MATAGRDTEKATGRPSVPGWLAAGVALLFCVAADAATPVAKSPDAAAAPSAPATGDAAQDLLNYLISSGTLTIEDAQKLVDKLRAEEQRKKADSLVNYLVESKTLSVEDAQKLLNDLRAGKTTPDKAAAAAPAQAAPEAPAADDKAKAADADKGPASRVHAVYLPDSERARIRDEIRQEVMATARQENWAQPDAIPEWVRRIRVSGDFLLREQADFLDRSNDPALNFQAINSGAPVDIFVPATSTPQKVLTIPYLNTVENRQALKMRAHLSLQSEVNAHYDFGLRLATGNTSNPVSATQTLGNDLNKNNFLLDRAWLRYRAEDKWTLIGGRMPSPWVAPTELVWDKDLGFDGLAAQYKVGGERRNFFATAGMFPLASTDPNYPSVSPFKVASRDKTLFGLQFGADAQTHSGVGLRAALAYYDFHNIEGKLSSICYAPTSGVPCDTDNSRPGFEQKGNTMFALRLLNRPSPATDPEFQYFGLASQFRVLNLNLGLDNPLGHGLHAQVDVDIARNLSFNSDRIEAQLPVNNFASCPAGSPNCAPSWAGGGKAWQTQLRVGHAKIEEAAQWNTLLGYRYVETDAVVDGFTDSDFHQGGTNAKGFYIGGNLGLAHNVWAGVKYMSAKEVTGWHLSADVLQVDLNARF